MIWKLKSCNSLIKKTFVSLFISSSVIDNFGVSRVVIEQSLNVQSNLSQHSEYRPPVYNDEHFCFNLELLLHKWPLNNDHLSTNGHYFWVPRVVVLHRFDCIRIHVTGGPRYSWTFYLQIRSVTFAKLVQNDKIPSKTAKIRSSKW